MIVKFDKEIYDSIWTGGVDKLLSYDTERREFTVQDVKTGEVRKHRTMLNLNNTSLSPIRYSRIGRDEIEEYLRSLNVDKISNLRKRTKVMFAIKEDKGKIYVYFADKDYFDKEGKVKDPYDLYSQYTDEICNIHGLDMEDDFIYYSKIDQSKETLKANLEGFGLIENPDIINLIEYPFI